MLDLESGIKWLCRPLKKAKFSHTHCRALGPELIPMYRQLAHRWLFKSSPGGILLLFYAGTEVTFQAEERYHLSTSTKCANNLPKVVTQLCPCENWTHNLLIASPTFYLCTTAPPFCLCICDKLTKLCHHHCCQWLLLYFNKFPFWMCAGKHTVLWKKLTHICYSFEWN